SAGSPTGDFSVGGYAGGFQQVNAAFFGDLDDLRHAGLSEPAAGSVYDPVERHQVGGVDTEPQVGEGVFHFGTVVEAGAADDLVGDAGTHEGFFERPGLGVGAV